jgi:hypothetical protein
VSPLFFDELVLLALVWLFVRLLYAGPSDRARPSSLAAPSAPRRKRPRVPKPLRGLTCKPHGAAWAQEAMQLPSSPPVPPAPRLPTPRRPGTVATSMHFCPHAGCAYRGWRGRENLRAHGPPHGGPWRPFHCTICGGYVLENHETSFHGKRVPVELIVRVLACLAAGLGIRGTARVFEIDPNTVLSW